MILSGPCLLCCLSVVWSVLVRADNNSIMWMHGPRPGPGAGAGAGPIWIIFHFHDSILLSSSVWARGEKVPRLYQDSK